MLFNKNRPELYYKCMKSVHLMNEQYPLSVFYESIE
jgi:hypothetical protein